MPYPQGIYGHREQPRQDATDSDYIHYEVDQMQLTLEMTEIQIKNITTAYDNTN